MALYRAAALCLALLLCAGAAGADVPDYIGQVVQRVSLESEGRVLDDAQLASLVRTATGAPLTMREVRDSLVHLFSLGQFEDVLVHAEKSAGGVALTYELVPLRAIGEVDFSHGAAPGISESRLRQMLIERFGREPRPTHAQEMAQAVAQAIANVGYLQAHVTARLEPRTTDKRSKLTLAIEPGARATIGNIDVQGDAGVKTPDLLSALDVRRGAPFERDRLNGRVDRYIEQRRRKGHFQARLSVNEAVVDNQSVNLTIAVQQGPFVKVVFAGDPVPVDRRDDLVPIGREGSADEDLLEDASRRIEEFFQNQGYRDVAAPHTREEIGGELVVTFTVKKGGQYRVESVDLEGNAAIPADDISALLRIRAGQPFSAATLDADLSQIEEAYRRRGFATAHAEASTTVRPPAADQHVPLAVRIEVTENTQTLVNSVSFEGNTSVPDTELRAAIGLGPGGPFSAAQMALDRDGIELLYANRGFQRSSVETRPALAADGRQADVVFVVREGTRVYVDHVLIVGNTRTKTGTIERELRFRSGDPLGLEAISESQRRLAAMGLFRRARITQLGYDEDTRRDVLVTVEEAPLTTVGYGGGFEVRARTVSEGGVATESLEFAPRASFEIGRRNLFGTNRSVNLFTSASLHPSDSSVFQNQAPGTSTESGIFGFPEYRLLGQFREPHFSGTSADLRLTTTIEQQIRSSFNFARQSAAAELAVRLPRKMSASAGYQIQRTRLFDQKIPPEEQRNIDRLFPQLRLSSFFGSLIRDTRNDPVDPSDGQYYSANGQLAARAIGSEVGFAKSFFTAQAFRTVPRSRGVIAAVSARVGAAVGFPRPDGLRDLPASERFYAGGDTTVRGFALDRLGVQHTPQLDSDTLDSGGFALGGNALLLLNGELRVPVRSSVKVVGFVDVGNVFKTVSDVQLDEMRPALGMGFRYKSPVGPLRFDVGFKVPRRDNESRTEWFITFGEAF